VFIKNKNKEEEEKEEEKSASSSNYSCRHDICLFTCCLFPPVSDYRDGIHD
jgi:hypothetical protein